MIRAASTAAGLFLNFAIAIALISAPSSASDRDETVNVKMKTSAGDIKLALYPNRAPQTVANFLKLVDEGSYNGAEFYRVVTKDNDNGAPKIEVIQGGIGDAAEELEPIPLEVTGETGVEHKDGAISMARGGVNTATSEFFICIGDQTSLDFGGTRNPDGQGFAAFGYVTDGMDVVKKIQGMKTSDDGDDTYVKGQMLSKPVKILKVARFDAEAEAAKPAPKKAPEPKKVEPKPEPVKAAPVEEAAKPAEEETTTEEADEASPAEQAPTEGETDAPEDDPAPAQD